MLSPDKPALKVSQGALKMRAWRERKRAGSVYSFVCVVCQKAGESGHPQTKCCETCRPAARQMSARLLTGAVAIGTEFACKNCGARFLKEHKRQFYCPPCSAISTADKLPSAVEWNRNYQREYQKRRRRENVAANINSRMSAGIKNSLRDGKNGRSWESLVGYALTDLMAHLERQFVGGMTWDNRGDWHIDHVRPLCSFEFQTPECPQFREAWALSNLQPLWGPDNLKKGGRWDG